MIRNFKALGLALVAALALSAMTASAASAAPALFTANSHVGKAGIHGGQTGTDTFTIGGLPSLTCATATLTGEAITAGTSSTYVTLNPTYHTCHVQVPFIGTRTATVTMNGCAYTFNATKNTGGKPFTADLTIECPPKKEIEIHIYETSNHNDAGAGTMCTFDIPHQTINDQIELTNTPSHDILAHINATVKTTNTLPKFLCGNTAEPNAIYKGEDLLEATNSVGASVGSTVS